MQGDQEVTTVIHKYFDGLFRGDVELLRSVFHPDAQLFGEVRGKPYRNSIEGFLTAVAGRKSPQAQGEAFAMQLLEVHLVNQVAQVRARCPMLGFNYLDLLALVNDGERWCIVNKTFTHVDV
jgi:hypothetical protein